MNLKKQLEEIGLSPKEAEIYLQLLILKDASAVQISKHIKIARTTIYDTLEIMRKKGLVSAWKKNRVSYYTAESPNKILKLEEAKIEALKNILPELRFLSDSNTINPSAVLYIGKEGAKKVLEDILEKSKMQKINTIYAYTKHDFMIYFPNATKKWISEREKNSIRIKLISPELPSDVSNSGYENNPLRELKIIKGNYNLESSIYIYGAYTALFYLDQNKMHSLIIESEQFSNTLKGFFEFMWDNLPATK